MITKEDLQKLTDGMGLRFDANEVSFLLRSLEYIQTQSYDRKYGPTKARMFIPINNKAPAGAKSITYSSWDAFGMAKVIANHASDLPKVGVFAKEFTMPVKTLGVAYDYTIEDLQAAAMSPNANLDSRKAEAAMMAMEQKVDQVLASGIPEMGIPGALNLANVPITAPPNAGAWTSLTPDQILENMHAISERINLNSLEVFGADTMLFPTTEYNYLNRTYVDATNRKTIMKTFLENDEYIKNVDQWRRLNTAGAGGVRRVMAYFRNPVVLEGHIPQEPQELPPQPNNLAFEIPVHSRISGVEAHYPMGITYADFPAS